MKRHVAALLAIVFLAGLETPSAAHDPSLSVHELRGAPLGAPAPSSPAAALPSASAHDVSVPANHDGAVGTALVGGWATWYDTPGLTAAAGPLLREALGDWRGQLIEVESGSRSVTVRLTDFCACGVRHGTPTIIDLSRDAFAELADPRLGILRVSIEIDPARHPDDDRMRAEDAATLPPTDVR